jgi:hypothetical protein
MLAAMKHRSRSEPYRRKRNRLDRRRDSHNSAPESNASLTLESIRIADDLNIGTETEPSQNGLAGTGHAFLSQGNGLGEGAGGNPLVDRPFQLEQ